MLDLGDRLVEYKERLSDALLSELSYEKKYALSKDRALYDRFVSAGKDFSRYLTEAGAIADTLGSKEILDNIEKQHSRYRTLVEEEAKRPGSADVYNPGRYKAEKRESPGSHDRRDQEPGTLCRR